MLRVSFSCDLKPKSGKQNFAIRLAKEFGKIGIKVVDKNPHVNLVFVKGFRKNCVNIIRLDGVWINSLDKYIDKKSKTLSNNFKKADAVIYQNNFCKQACDVFLGESRRSVVIPNGIDPDNFGISHVRDKPYFLALCKWRPHKRLKYIIDGFINSSVAKSHDLVICGKADYTVKHRSIIYLGEQPSGKILKLITGCSGTVHLAYLDWCPNSVIESLVARKPVLYADSGGTPEIVLNCGIKIKDKEWNFKVVKLYFPPSLSIEEVSHGYERLLSVPDFVREDLFISDIAKKYRNFIESIL